jgi:hypothetical protein
MTKQGRNDKTGEQSHGGAATAHLPSLRGAQRRGNPFLHCMTDGLLRSSQ